MKPSFVRGVACLALAALAAQAGGPSYTADGKLLPPLQYREWIFLTSGLDMSYRPGAGGDMHMFDNVFVEPAAYRAFLANGTWPEGTMLAKEGRGAASKGSINKTGSFQTAEEMGVEVHVKDTARFSGGWAFFDFDGKEPAPRIPEQAQCYSCHRAHGAVDTTFVQFYPTLLPLARQRKTLSEEYLKESGGE